MDKLSQELVLAAGKKALSGVVGVMADAAAKTEDAEFKFAILDLQARAILATILTFMPVIEDDAQLTKLIQDAQGRLLNVCNETMAEFIQAKFTADRIRESN